jgi:hypothetical protein
MCTNLLNGACANGGATRYGAILRDIKLCDLNRWFRSGNDRHHPSQDQKRTTLIGHFRLETDLFLNVTEHQLATGESGG